MKRTGILLLLLWLAISMLAVGCGGDDDDVATDGDVTDGDATDGDTEDGDTEDGDVEDGDTEDGDVTDGDVTDGDVTDGDVTDGDVTDGDVTDGDVTDGDVTDGDVQMDHSQLEQLAGPFEKGQDITAKCLECHADEATDIMGTHHWKWKGPTPGFEGHTEDANGKVSTINNFCIAVISNEARCTMCHAGYDWKAANDYAETTYDFEDSANVDCVVCHDTTSTYKKDKTTAGQPIADIDLAAVAQGVGTPSRKNCGFCHFAAGGGDGVKKGDMGSFLGTPSVETDVHMGNGMLCQDCHVTTDHKIMGSGMHSVPTEGPVDCLDCHEVAHENETLNNHAAKVACQTCHIPAFSRTLPTKTNWLWGEAGKETYPEGEDYTFDVGGEEPVVRPKYDKMKGEFLWEMNVRPTYAFFDGSYSRMLVGDTFSEAGTIEDPVMLSKPLATKDSPNAKLHPFKVMKGNQPADSNPADRKILVPHLFGANGQGGANGYWGAWDWNLALADGAYAVQNNPYFDGSAYTYSGNYDFAYTAMYMRINHEVAPASQALGCMDCHGENGLDWEALGYDGNPMGGK